MFKYGARSAYISPVAASEKEEAQTPHHFCIFAKNFTPHQFFKIGEGLKIQKQKYKSGEGGCKITIFI